jgi:hypothetical protein
MKCYFCNRETERHIRDLKCFITQEEFGVRGSVCHGCARRLMSLRRDGPIMFKGVRFTDGWQTALIGLEGLELKYPMKPCSICECDRGSLVLMGCQCGCQRIYPFGICTNHRVVCGKMLKEGIRYTTIVYKGPHSYIITGEEFELVRTNTAERVTYCNKCGHLIALGQLLKGFKHCKKCFEGISECSVLRDLLRRRLSMEGMCYELYHLCC